MNPFPWSGGVVQSLETTWAALDRLQGNSLSPGRGVLSHVATDALRSHCAPANQPNGKDSMTKNFLLTVQTPGDVPADRLELIRAEIEQHAAACVEFYGRQRPDQVRALLVNPLPAVPDARASLPCPHQLPPGVTECDLCANPPRVF